MDPQRFDTLTKSFGQARSRRTLLRTLGAATLGALGLAGGGPAVRAATGGTNAAAAFCATVFGDTRAAGQCTSAAAHGTGPYIECGGDPNRYCNGICCASAEICQGGTCVCAPAYSLCQGTAGSHCCPTGGCSADGTCTCLPSGTDCSVFFGTCDDCCSRGHFCENNTCTCF